ncbi:MAG: hypothetical protein FJW22_05985 [Acidimicrobiia bacterium]|nr:hypothetical protein [Acidimicrobiia bacterium]
MAVPPGNKLRALDVPLDGYFAVWVNRQFRLVFRFDGGHAYDVRCYDYHPHGK